MSFELDKSSGIALDFFAHQPDFLEKIKPYKTKARFAMLNRMTNEVKAKRFEECLEKIKKISNSDGELSLALALKDQDCMRANFAVAFREVNSLSGGTSELINTISHTLEAYIKAWKTNEGIDSNGGNDFFNDKMMDKLDITLYNNNDLHSVVDSCWPSSYGTDEDICTAETDYPDEYSDIKSMSYTEMLVRFENDESGEFLKSLEQELPDMNKDEKKALIRGLSKAEKTRTYRQLYHAISEIDDAENIALDLAVQFFGVTDRNTKRLAVKELRFRYQKALIKYHCQQKWEDIKKEI